MTTPNVSDRMKPNLYPSYPNNLEITYTIHKLPKEKIHEIFSYLRSIDLRASIATVCKEWNEISIYYLTNSKKQECKIILESINFLIQKLDEIVNFLDATLLTFEDNDLLNQKNESLDKKENIIKTKEILSVIEKQTEINSSSELRKRVVEQLINLHSYNLATLIQYVKEDKKASPHVHVLVNLADYTTVFLYWSNLNLQNFVQVAELLLQPQSMLPTEETKIQKLDETCLKFMELDAFGKALDCASKIPTRHPLYNQYAQCLQEQAIKRIAGALAQKGYVGQALEIAENKLFAGVKKFDVLKSIVAGLNISHLFGHMREIINKIPANFIQIKTEFQQSLIDGALKKSDKIEDAVETIVGMTDQTVCFQEMRKMGQEFFNRKELNLAEKMARLTNHYSLLARIAIDWSNQGNLAKGEQVVLATPAGKARRQVLKSIVIINELRAMMVSFPSILKKKT